MSQVESYRDWFRDGPLAGRPQAHRSFMLVPEADRVIATGPIHVANVSPPAGGVVEPPMPEYSLNLMLRSGPLLRVGFNRPPRWLAVAPGSMLFAPPDVSNEFISDVPVHVLAVVIPKAVVEDFAQDAGVRLDLRHEEMFRDPRLAQQLVRLWHELADDAPGSRLLADHVLRSGLRMLVRRAAADSRAASRAAASLARERLANHTVRRLRDFVENSLGDELDVTGLADVAELSPAHFARAFAATVGMTPFEYVMTRRLARARELLERTQRSTLDIALDVGFKTPSHFSSRFRREFGFAPRAIRSDPRRSHVGLEL